MDEELLAGGNMEPVVRVGDTVRRVAGPWTPAVQELLAAIRAKGVTGVPRPLGLDERGREMLGFLPGTVLDAVEPGVRFAPAVLDRAAALLRRMHDASVGLATAEREWRSPAHEPREVVCHNDFAPYNLLLLDGETDEAAGAEAHGALGAIDFDFASPGPRLWDLAYLAYRLVPFAEDADGYEPARDGERRDRARRLLAAYGHEAGVDELRAAAAARLDELAAFTEERAASTGRAELDAHAAMYRRDAELLRRLDAR